MHALQHTSSVALLLSIMRQVNVCVQFPWASRQLLHAVRMRVTHPRTGEPLDLQAPLPSDFLNALEHVSLQCSIPDSLPPLPEK